MPGNGTNIYQTARLAAGLTQERAAELLDASVESIKAYETGQRLPPDARVAAMADVYGSPGLRLQHARATDELGVLPEEEAPLVLSRVTVTLVRTMLEWAEEHAGLALLRIAEDDRIDADERPIFDGIVAVQPADLIPLPENGRTDSRTPDGERFFESTAPDL